MSKSFKTFCSANTRICVHLTFHMHFNYILIKDWNGNSLCLSQLGAKNFRWADKMLFFCYCKIHVGAHSPVRTKRKLRRKATWTGSHYIRPPTRTASRELGVEAQRVVDLFEGLLRWRLFDGWFIMVGRGRQTQVHEQNQASHLLFVNDTLLIHSHAQFTVLCSVATLWQNLYVSSKQKIPVWLFRGKHLITWPTLFMDNAL